MDELTLFNINHSLQCRGEGYTASIRFDMSQRQRVKTALRLGPLTALEIEEATGIRLSSVNGRLNELLARGEVRKSGSRINLVSGIRNCLWGLT